MAPDFLANGIATFLKENSIPQSDLYLGFTFPFAMEKESIHQAIITSLSKNYEIQNAVGKDVCTLMQDALNRASVGVKCVAVVNDVCGTPSVELSLANFPPPRRLPLSFPSLTRRCPASSVRFDVKRPQHGLTASNSCCVWSWNQWILHGVWCCPQEDDLLPWREDGR